MLYVSLNWQLTFVRRSGLSHRHRKTPTTILWLSRAPRVHQDLGLRPIITTTSLQRPRADIEHCTRRLQRMYSRVAMKTKRCQMLLDDLVPPPATESALGFDDYGNLIHDNFQHNNFFASGRQVRRPRPSVHIKRCADSSLYYCVPHPTIYSHMSF